MYSEQSNTRFIDTVLRNRNLIILFVQYVILVNLTGCLLLFRQIIAPKYYNISGSRRSISLKSMNFEKEEFYVIINIIFSL